MNINGVRRYGALPSLSVRHSFGPTSRAVSLYGLRHLWVDWSPCRWALGTTAVRFRMTNIRRAYVLLGSLLARTGTIVDDDHWECG